MWRGWILMEYHYIYIRALGIYRSHKAVYVRKDGRLKKWIKVVASFCARRNKMFCSSMMQWLHKRWITSQCRNGIIRLLPPCTTRFLILQLLTKSKSRDVVHFVPELRNESPRSLKGGEQIKSNENPIPNLKLFSPHSAHPLDAFDNFPIWKKILIYI